MKKIGRIVTLIKSAKRIDQQKMRKIVSILFFIVSLVHYSVGQKLTASVSSSRVAVGEAFQIQFSLSGSGSNFKLPQLTDFEIIEGPYQSSSTSIVNGVVTQSSSLTYVLVGKKEGKYTIGPASASSQGKTIQSNIVDMDVLKGKTAAGNPNTSSNQNSAPSTNNGTDDVAGNLFIKTSVSKTKVFQGEQISVIQKVYSRFQLRDFQNIQFPSYNGFWTQDEPLNKQITVQNENINGVSYQVAELKRTFIFAQKSGKLEIDPMKIDCLVRKKSSRKPRDIFEQFFGGGYEDVVCSIKSDPITIDVSALPEANKPAGFSGAVGEYTFKAQLNKDKVKANDGVNLTITLTGKGNIKLVDLSKIDFPEDFETYDPKTSENIIVGGNGVSGTKTFDFLMIPRHEGDYKIDQVNFSYFDPSKKEYITIPSPEFNLHVDKGDNTPATVVGSSNRQEDLKVLGNDIRYIKTDKIHLKSKDAFFFGSIPFIIGLLSPLIAFLGFIFIRRKNIEQNKDMVAVKSRKATKMAKKRLSIAEKHLRSNNKELFYIEIFKSLDGYISDKLNIPVADFNKEHISQTLKSRDVSTPTILLLMKTLDNCEYAHYAPSAVSEDLQTIYTSTVELITNIEDEIK